MKRTPFFLPLLLLLGCGSVFAAQATPGTPTWNQGCNHWREIRVAFSTQTPVLISSAPLQATQMYLNGSTVTSKTLGINLWSFRQIVNTADAPLMIVPQSSSTISNVSGQNYTTFSTTWSIVLSSDTTGNGLGDTYIVPNQAQVYGIWGAGATKGGAGGEEDWCE